MFLPGIFTEYTIDDTKNGKSKTPTDPYHRQESLTNPKDLVREFSKVSFTGPPPLSTRKSEALLAITEEPEDKRKSFWGKCPFLNMDKILFIIGKSYQYIVSIIYNVCFRCNVDIRLQEILIYLSIEIKKQCIIDARQVIKFRWDVPITNVQAQGGGQVAEAQSAAAAHRTIRARLTVRGFKDD